MDIQSTKYELIKMIMNIENIEIINYLKQIITNNDFWDQLTENEKKEIEKGLKDLDEGRRISFDTFLKNIS